MRWTFRLSGVSPVGRLGGLGTGRWLYSEAAAQAHQFVEEVLDGDVRQFRGCEALLRLGVGLTKELFEDRIQGLVRLECCAV
jgi:hypothetical protein